MKKTLFLDRDGVLNPLVEQEGSRISPQHPDQFEFLPGAPGALQDAKQAGYQLIVITNQPDVEKAWRPLTQEHLDAMNAILKEEGVDAVYACTHGPYGDAENYTYKKNGRPLCSCRKPGTGLLEWACAEQEVVVSDSYVIGDRVTDITAATQFEEECGERFAGRLFVGGNPPPNADGAVQSLKQAVQWVGREQ